MGESVWETQANRSNGSNLLTCPTLLYYYILLFASNGVNNFQNEYQTSFWDYEFIRKCFLRNWGVFLLWFMDNIKYSLSHCNINHWNKRHQYWKIPSLRCKIKRYRKSFAPTTIRLFSSHANNRWAKALWQISHFSELLYLSISYIQSVLSAYGS